MQNITRLENDLLDRLLRIFTAIVWLYRGQTDRFVELVGSYLSQAQAAAAALPAALTALDDL